MLQKWRDGDQDALDAVMPLVYNQLKQLAHACVRNERKGHSMNTTALVHEAYLKMADLNKLDWKDRAHFLSMASRTMRRILIDYARKRNAAKRSGKHQKVDLDERYLLDDDKVESLLELDDALETMEKTYPQHSKAVVLYYFGGLTLEEVGKILNVSPPTTMRYLRFAQAFIARIWKRNV